MNLAWTASHGLQARELPAFTCGAAEYRGCANGIQAAFDSLEQQLRQQALTPTRQRRMRVRFLNRDVDYVDLELLAGVR